MYMSLDSSPGKWEAKLHLDLGKGNKLDFSGEAIGEELMAFLEEDAYAHGSLSVDLDGLLPHFLLIHDIMGGRSWEVEEGLKENFNLGWEDIVTLFSGRVIFSRNGFSGESEEPSYLVEGTTLITYQETGLPGFPAILMCLDGSVLRYFYDYGFDMVELDERTMERVPEDYQLPEPPEGMKEFTQEELKASWKPTPLRKGILTMGK